MLYIEREDDPKKRSLKQDDGVIKKEISSMKKSYKNRIKGQNMSTSATCVNKFLKPTSSYLDSGVFFARY